MSQPEDSKHLTTAQILDPGNAYHALDSLNLRLACQAAPWRWKPSLKRILSSLQEGQTLEVAFGTTQARCPKELRSLTAAALQLPDPTKYLVEAIISPQNARTNQQQVKLLLGIIALFVLISSVICAGINYVLSELLIEAFEDWELSQFNSIVAQIRDQGTAYRAILMIGLWIGAGWITVRLTAPAWARPAILGSLPLFGRPIRWSLLSEWLDRYVLVLKQTPDPVLATRLCSESYVGSELHKLAVQIHRNTQNGMPLGVAMQRSTLSDGLCTPALLSLDRRPEHIHNCQQVSKMLCTLANSRLQLATGTIPLVLLVTVGVNVVGVLTSYLSVIQIFVKAFTIIAW